MSKPHRIIRSVKTSILFANSGKQQKVSEFISEYKRVAQILIDRLWEEKGLNRFGNQELSKNIETWLSARALQCCLKQTSGIVRGVREKQKRRLFIINKLESSGQFKKARQLQKIYDQTKISRPKVSRLKPQLDNRFFDLKWHNQTSFDGWITLSSLGRKTSVTIPLKKFDLLNQRLNQNIFLNSIILSDKNVGFCFQILPGLQVGKTIGVDVGVKSCVTASNGETEELLDTDKDGWTLDKITEKLARRKSGSKGFKRAVEHRKNFIRCMVNKINLSGVGCLNRENIKGLRKNKRVPRKLARFTYRDIFTAIDNKCTENGVRISLLNPRYTSQRCSICGWTQKSNRSGKKFVCKKCSYATDADKNASRNLALSLEPLEDTLKKSNDRPNISGFYWNSGEEPIVPRVLEPNDFL